MARLPYIQELVSMIGLADLARLEVEAVKVRPVPPQLLVDIARADDGRGIPSPRQQQILGMLADGVSQPEIADELGVDLETIRSHTKSLRRKLGARTQTQLIIRGIQLGYLQV